MNLPLLQDLREKIDQYYRVRLILDNLPITTNDLEGFPENIRPGYQVCFDKRLPAASQALPHAVFEHIHSKPSMLTPR